VAPVMTQETGASPFAEWAEALLRAPLDAAERGEAAREASELAERGEHAAAGERLLDIASALRSRGFKPAAVLLIERAAHVRRGPSRARGRAVARRNPRAPGGRATDQFFKRSASGRVLTYRTRLGGRRPARAGTSG